jgi:hypothetical protein
MLIKRADDPSKRLALLESLKDSPNLDARQKAWAGEELARTRRALQGARDVAHALDEYLGDSRNYALLHDLRLEFGAEVAHIDHLLIGRSFEFTLLHSRHSGADLRIDARGGVYARYGDEPEFALAPPLDDSRRHERLLVKALEMLGITVRVSARPSFHHVLLVDRPATIERPGAGASHGVATMTAGEFRDWHERLAAKDTSFASVLTGVMHVRAGETIEVWGRALAGLHRPADPTDLPDFMAQGDVEAVPGITSPAGKRRSKKRKRIAPADDAPAGQRPLV